MFEGPEESLPEDRQAVTKSMIEGRHRSMNGAAGR